MYIKQGFTTYPIKIDFFSENYVGYRKNDEIIIHTDVCPHNGASLAKGWINKNGNLQCPYHGFEFCNGVFHKIPNPSCNSSNTFNGFKMNVYDTKEDKKIAERRVRVGLYFAEFGIQNKLDLTETELNAAFENESRRYPGQEQEYLKFIKSNPQAQQALRGPLFEEKVVNSILEAVTLKEKKLSVVKFKEQMEKLN